MAKVPGLGEGEEYELVPDIELVHTGEKVLAWRTERFMALGFSKGEAQSLARWRSAELHDVTRWIEQGCTHAQVLRIVAPLVQLPTVDEVAEYTQPKGELTP